MHRKLLDASWFNPWHSPWWGAVFCALWLAAVAAIGFRAYSKYQQPGPFDSARQGFCDFHNGIYFPAAAYRAGISPYGREYAEQYPVARPIPFFAPLTMVLHLHTLLDLPHAAVVHFGFLLALSVLLGWLAARCAGLPPTINATMAAAAFVVVSRGGYATLFTGYFTFLLAIGTILTLQFAHRPTVAAPAMLLACLKPTYAIPLAIVLAARRQWRTLVAGVLLVTVANAAAVGWLLQFHSPEQLIADVRLAQGLHLDDPNEMPINSWTRIDAMAIVAKWLNWNPGEIVYLLAMVPLITLPALALWKLSADGRAGTATDLSGLIACLAILVTVYHHYYDALILIPVIIALGCNTSAWRSEMSSTKRVIVFVLLAFMMMNYLSAQFVMERFQLTGMPFQVVTSINGILLIVALGIAVWEALVRLPPAQPVNLELESGS